MKTHYPINIDYDAEDGDYIATVPDLPGCSAFGETPEEALQEVLKAKEAWIESARTNGKPIPSSHSHPVIYQIA